MNPADVVFVALKKQVAALKKSDGTILWVASLPGGLGDSFVTLSCDDTRIYAHTQGQIHCLDIITGNVLWSNPLKGFGYGVASICLYGFPPAPDPAAYTRILAAQQASQTAASGAGAGA
jgi:outer membrane protein assembly factor BamB